MCVTQNTLVYNNCLRINKGKIHVLFFFRSQVIVFKVNPLSSVMKTVQHSNKMVHLLNQMKMVMDRKVTLTQPNTPITMTYEDNL